MFHRHWKNSSLHDFSCVDCVFLFFWFECSCRWVHCCHKSVRQCSFNSRGKKKAGKHCHNPGFTVCLSVKAPWLCLPTKFYKLQTSRRREEGERSAKAHLHQSKLQNKMQQMILNGEMWASVCRRNKIKPHTLFSNIGQEPVSHGGMSINCYTS